MYILYIRHIQYLSIAACVEAASFPFPINASQGRGTFPPRDTLAHQPAAIIAPT